MNPLKKHYITIENSAKKKLLKKFSKEETVRLWQARFFINILFYLVIFGPFILIPATILAFMSGMFLLVACQLLAYLVLLFLCCYPPLRLYNRKVSLITTLYLLGVVLFYSLGWSGPALIYLLGISLFAALLISSRAGYFTWGLNILTILTFAIGARFNLFDNILISSMDTISILTISLNMVLLNVVLIATISSLFRGLKKKIASENRIKKRLKKEIELHRKAKEKAEESNRFKSAFLANVSHEIRTPINGILGFTDILHTQQLREEKQKEYLDIIRQSGYQMLSIINNLIDLSRIESGYVEVVYKKTSIPSLIKNFISFFMPEAEKKGLHLQFHNHLSPSEYTVRTDQEKLHAILSNLMKNAIKYSKKGVITVSCKQDGDAILYTVKDQGVGIPKEQQALVFDRFFRIKTPDKNFQEGSGLGLSIANAYAKLLNGEITLESEEEKGSAFTLILPVKP